MGTTNQRLNYAFTSIGNSINLQAGETKTLALYERQIVGEYAFGDSPDTIHIPVNSNFDFSTQALGIEAFKLNFSGNIEKVFLTHRSFRTTQMLIRANRGLT